MSVDALTEDVVVMVEERAPMERLSAYADLTARKRTLEADLKATQAAIDALEPGLLNWYAETGTSSIKANGATVYLHRQLWARPADGDWDRAVTAAKDAGLGDLVQERFNLNTMSAWVREREAAGEALPASFEGAISVAEEFSLRVRRS